jgi:hypothetical protein
MGVWNGHFGYESGLEAADLGWVLDASSVGEWGLNLVRMAGGVMESAMNLEMIPDELNTHNTKHLSTCCD